MKTFILEFPGGVSVINAEDFTDAVFLLKEKIEKEGLNFNVDDVKLKKFYKDNRGIQSFYRWRNW